MTEQSFSQQVAQDGEAEGYPCYCRSHEPAYEDHDTSCPVFIRGDHLSGRA